MSGELLFTSPAAGFDAPFEMLAACHERVQRSLRLLERLAEHLTTHGADEQARSAARDVLRYFDIAAPQHHGDEERHVLPALRELGEATLADRVLADHAALARAWSALRPPLCAVEAGDASSALAPRVAAAWRDFAALHRAHMALEDGAVFPRAAATLDAAAQQAMGQEMARRRGELAG